MLSLSLTPISALLFWDKWKQLVLRMSRGIVYVFVNPERIMFRENK